MNQADVRNLDVAGSVSDGRVAAPGIPPQQSPVRQGHANERFQAVCEVNMPGKGGNDFSSTQLVEHRVRAFEKTGESLTVLAVAKRADCHVRRTDVALQRAASTLQRMVHSAQATSRESVC